MRRWPSILVAVLSLALWVSVLEAAPSVGIGWDGSPDATAVLRGLSDGQMGLSAFTWWIADEWLSGRWPLEVSVKIRYARWTLDYDRFDLDFGRSRNLYCLDSALKLAGPLWEGGKTMVFLVPALESASEWSLKPKDLKLSTGFLQRYDLGRGNIGVGVAWLRTFGRGQLVPLVEVAWPEPGETLEARVLVPLEAEVAWRPWRFLSMDVGMRVARGGVSYG